MQAFDPLLAVVADAAKVRPPHVFHIYHAIREMGKRFHVGACAQFMRLEPHHVEAVVAALHELELYPTKAKAEPVKRASRLPDDWIAPDEWIAWASEQRRWQPGDAMEEARLFANYWQSKSGQQATKLSWMKTWQNWVMNSRRPQGDYSPPAPAQNCEERAASLRSNIALYERMGREDECGKWRKELAEIEGNVLPFERKVG